MHGEAWREVAAALKDRLSRSNQSRQQEWSWMGLGVEEEMDSMEDVQEVRMRSEEKASVVMRERQSL